MKKERSIIKIDKPPLPNRYHVNTSMITSMSFHTDPSTREIAKGDLVQHPAPLLQTQHNFLKTFLER